MTSHHSEASIEAVSRLLSDIFEIDAVYRQNEELVFSLRYQFSRLRSRDILTDRLHLAGYEYAVSEHEDGVMLRVHPRRKLRVPRVNIVLFVITLVSVYFVPVFYANLMAATDRLARALEVDTTGLDWLAEVWLGIKLLGSAVPPALEGTLADLGRGAGLEFTAAMMSILFVHEMGHYIASRRRSIVTSWPYFIPAPNIIGTFGAVIKSKSPFLNRRDLIEVGSAGPIAGWIVAVGWLVYGLTQSGYFPATAFTVKELAFSMHGESLLMRAATYLLVGPAPDGYFYRLSEAAFAGWVGLLVTAINMLPIGQLDGGHVIYGLGRRYQHMLGTAAMVGLLFLGFQSGIWWLFAALGLIFGVKHPPTLNDRIPPSPTARAMGVAALIILIISFTPVPFAT